MPKPSPPGAPAETDHVAAMRRFNRFYTRRTGLLREGLLATPFSLTQSRIIYELANRKKPTASELIKELGLDAGYVSRLLRGLRQKGLIESEPAKQDARQSLLSLTKRGRSEANALDERSNAETAALLEGLPGGEAGRLVEAMRTIQAILSGEPQDKGGYVLRAHEPGDMGSIIRMHGALYAREYGFNEEFEALVAEIAAGFLRKHDAAWERCWVAEREGRVAGSVMLVKESKKVARLRLLLVAPEARGCGLGMRLVEECIRFAREAGYRRITLWTQDLLSAARHLYEKAGFRLVEEQRRHNFGQDMVSETWELKL